KPRKVFNVRKYGAVSDGRTESSKAFLEAWKDACEWRGRTKVVIPKGEYVLDSVVFQGECKGPIAFQLKGTLKPAGNLKDTTRWITFRYVDRLTISGGGYFDGQGERLWDCTTNPHCYQRAISLRLESISNGKVHHIRSVNSQNAHMSLYGCNKMEIYKVRLTAPEESPNTDGIKIGGSEQVRIWGSKIGTGDDCVAIVAGSKNINISDVHCGPGHGISVGSMGGYPGLKEDTVVGVTVQDCTFDGTDHGIRIKTRSSPNPGLASNFHYRNIRMINVRKPIMIDQHYCPNPPCHEFNTPSHIQIKDLTFDNIWGTSATQVALTLNCSAKYPCTDILLKNINLHSASVGDTHGGPTTSSCAYANGRSYGTQNPPPCF
ncbi:hypothetical protein Tsubulata_000929, partial [Turnera subulata]